MSPWHSNHEACFITGLPILRHLITLRILKFYISFTNYTSNNCIGNLKYYMLFHSNLRKYLYSFFSEIYGVSDILNNDLSALKARISYVQNNESWSSYAPFMLINNP